VVQVTTPRSPCFKLAARVGSPLFLRTFLQSGRLGFYLRVLEEGEVRVADTIERVSEEPQRLTVLQMAELLYSPVFDPATLERALEIRSLKPNVRVFLEERRSQIGRALV
jgi:MOSC domain-containing protein YiiM